MPVSHAVIFILVINVISLGVAMLSYEFFESKLLQLKDRFKPRFQKRSELEMVA